MYVLSKNKVTSIFKEEVRKYLDEQDIIYTYDNLARGKTGIEFSFDFQIAYKKREIVLNSFSKINRVNFSSFLFSWEDIKPIRQIRSQKEVTTIAIINDEKEIKGVFLDGLKSKNADYILWSERDKPENLAKIRA